MLMFETRRHKFLEILTNSRASHIGFIQNMVLLLKYNFFVYYYYLIARVCFFKCM